ncbi:MAG: 50S ribosome-binding GTPase, partial [Rhodospirillaceae bacterium]|nr:50S ribosome-binding GTPase [Rhodospirillaceae bacterium]
MADCPTTASRCGFVALLGAPNSGKSTLVNALTGAKVSIVSRKAQTTRTRILGITMVGEGVSASQVIFVDTPGVFAPHCRLDRAMVSAAWQGAADADLVAVLVDSVKALHHTDADTLRI